MVSTAMHASVGSPISSDTFPRSFDCVINLQVDGGKNRFMEKMFAGEYKTQHVLVFNAGESEMCREFEYHSTGLWFASYTEVTGAFTMDRFTPAAENVHVVSYPYIWLQDQLIRHGSNKEQFTHSVFQEIFSVGAPRVLFTYMMRQPKPHRRMMWDLLEKENLVNEFCTNAEKGICLDLKDNTLTDMLFAKALHFEKRKRFLMKKELHYIGYTLSFEFLDYYIKKHYNNDRTYRKILNRIKI